MIPSVRPLRPLLLVLLLIAPLPAAWAATTVVTAARMIDVLTGRVIEQPQIVITDERITSVGRQGDPAPADAKRIDLGSRTLLPGLIDMHVHLTSDPIYSGYRRLQFTDAFWMTVGVANARRALDAGFTTVRNVGSPNYDDVLFGTDAGVYPHGQNARQFAKMVEWGMTPMEAIQAATRSAAEALGRTADVGAIPPGRYADLIAVDGNPLSDIRVLEAVAVVMKGGQIVKGPP